MRRSSSQGFSSYRCSPNHPPLGDDVGFRRPRTNGGKRCLGRDGAGSNRYQLHQSREQPQARSSMGTYSVRPRFSPELEEAIATQESIYGEHVPAGLVVVAGSEAWINGYIRRISSSTGSPTLPPRTAAFGRYFGSSGVIVIGQWALGTSRLTAIRFSGMPSWRYRSKNRKILKGEHR